MMVRRIMSRSKLDVSDRANWWKTSKSSIGMRFSNSFVISSPEYGVILAHETLGEQRPCRGLGSTSVIRPRGLTGNPNSEFGGVFRVRFIADPRIDRKS